MSENKSIGDWVIYKNNQLIAFNKPPSITVQKDKTGDKALKNLAEIYCKHPLHLIHRLDRPASGIILFAKNKKALAHLNKQFQERTVFKEYLAVVKDKPESTTATLIHFLSKNQKQNKSYASEEEKKNTKKAELSYELMHSIDNYHLLKIKLLTGRHHQIRTQLAAINSPIKGDVKYGARRNNADRSIHLHAWKLSFTHPITKEMVELKADLPKGDSVWEAFNEML